MGLKNAIQSYWNKWVQPGGRGREPGISGQSIVRPGAGFGLKGQVVPGLEDIIKII